MGRDEVRGAGDTNGHSKRNRNHQTSDCRTRRGDRKLSLRGANKGGGSQMSQYEREITSYRQRQVKLRRQISALTSGKGTGDDKVEKDREATIRRTHGQI